MHICTVHHAARLREIAAAETGDTITLEYQLSDLPLLGVGSEAVPVDRVSPRPAKFPVNRAALDRALTAIDRAELHSDKGSAWFIVNGSRIPLSAQSVIAAPTLSALVSESARAFGRPVFRFMHGKLYVSVKRGVLPSLQQADVSGLSAIELVSILGGV